MSKEKSVHAWIKRIPPTVHGEYEEFIELFTKPGSPTIFGHVSWNHMKKCYEMRPVCFVSNKTYVLTHMRVNLAFYCYLKHLFRSMGVKHFVDVTCIDKVPTRKAELPLSLQPTLVPARK